MPDISRRQVLRGVVGAGAWLGGLRVADLIARVPAASAGPWRPSVAEALPDDLAYLTIAEASALVAAKQVSPVELVDACLDRIARFDASIQSWATVLADDARAQARAAADEIARDGVRSPLHGIPVGHKDLLDVAGVRTGAGSKVYADEPVPTRDATVVARLRAAGAIALGKTTTHEFGLGAWTPPTSNPWDTTRVPGGSSGGSAAALASGMCLGATGSDGGGSVRIPAALCNATGIKPTFGRVSKAGAVPGAAPSLGHVGPMARAVEDLALLLNVMAGPDAADPTSADAPVPDFTSGIGRDVSGLTVGVPTSVFFDQAEAEVRQLVADVVPVLESLGVRVVPVDVPATQRSAGAAFVVIFTAEPFSAHEHFLKQRPQDYMPQSLQILGIGASWGAHHYLRAQRIRTMNVLEWVELFGDVDAVLTPAAPRPAPTKQEASATGVTDLSNYAAFFNVNGCPSLSVPAGFAMPALPVGAMFSARPFDEVRLLQLGYAYQEATGFGRRRPPLA
jgi:aspartyl-tRNA(Asn)/glutamyl-tRNA(Gln) amidotransferase subunit A